MSRETGRISRLLGLNIDAGGVGMTPKAETRGLDAPP